ncbi:MAG: 3-deoxy-7-phosphoheptulonate synthase class II [Bdellovibrionales bacterium]|nr:3-deoxy-7-phosphoheptulonate synthase class II [Bdellovibrionales bacterium]
MKVKFWSKDSWKDRAAHQLPTYPDKNELKRVEAKLETLPPLVFGGEVFQLRQLLASAAQGETFVLQGGDCAESFSEFNTETIRDTFRVLLQMSVIFSFMSEKPIVKIGRCAGQFAKPRSSDTETINGITLPAYRGDIINGSEFTESERVPDPNRILTAYFQSTATLNFLRAMAAGGFADTQQAPNWILDFVENAAIKEKYLELAHLIQKRFDFIQKYNIQQSARERMDFYTSHEALLLPYEQALTRLDASTGKYIATSAHFLWIGDRTRQPDGAHVDFLRGVENPIGIKCGPSLSNSDLLQLIETLNPHNTPGRITLISRMGAGKVDRYLTGLISAVKARGLSVVWMCDPMHGNTEKNEAGIKYRAVEKILSEIQEFFTVCRRLGVYPGGLHLEMTGKNVTECLGGPRKIDLTEKYETFCDPRLNDEQAIDLAFKVCELLQAKPAFEFHDHLIFT